MRNTTAAAFAAGGVFGSMALVVLIKEKLMATYGESTQIAEGDAGIYASGLEEDIGQVLSDILRRVPTLDELGDINVEV